MREIVFDTETTGLNPLGGDRMVEIGCVEMFNRVETGKPFHAYFNPEREMPSDAEAVHGLTTIFLSDKPRFSERAEELLDFIGDSPLVAHNALFDLGFLNTELERCAKTPFGRERLVDTLILARRRHPAGPNRLDDLCTRYGIDNSRRTKHGALLDAEILAEIHLELIGGRQASLILHGGDREGYPARNGSAAVPPRPTPLIPRLSEAERESHARFVASLGGNAIWLDYRSVTSVGAVAERNACAS